MPSLTLRSKNHLASDGRDIESPAVDRFTGHHFSGPLVYAYPDYAEGTPRDCLMDYHLAEWNLCGLG